MSNCRKLLGWTALFCSLTSAANAQFTQQGTLETPGLSSFALSADGSTALVGESFANINELGSAQVFTRSGGVWTQQGEELVGSDAIGPAFQGWSVALSADGNTALVGGFMDNQLTGAAWVFTRSGSTWTQQGGKLVGTGAVGAAAQGWSVALSGDGNTALLGAPGDNNHVGAVCVFIRSGGVWAQQGNKLVGTGWTGSSPIQGSSVALSGDGDTALVGGEDDDGNVGATWVFTRSAGVWSQQGSKLVGSGASGLAFQGYSVSLSADSNTALIGGLFDNQSVGAAWVFTRSGGVWAQQGGKLTASGAIGTAQLGTSTALSADGDTALLGGPSDNAGFGAVWIFTRTGGTWSQQGNKLIGGTPPKPGNQGLVIALSGDAYTALVSSYGGTFVFVKPKPSTTTLSASTNPSSYGQLVTYTATVTAGATGAVTFTIDGVAQSTVPLNSSQAHFSISNLTPGGHTVSAAYSGDATFSASTSNVIAQTVNPLGVISLWANTVVDLGQSARLPVSLAKAAPPAGLTIYLASSDPSKVTVTPSVFIAGGRLIPNLPPVVNGVNLGSATITATALGYTQTSQSVRVTATIAFARCCLTVFAPTTQSAVLTLSAPAHAGGLTIQLIADDPRVATVPATISFPANATSVNVPITGVKAGATAIHAGALPNLAQTSIQVTVR